MMEVLKGDSILSGIVSAAEHDQIPSEIAKKVDAVLNAKFEELLTNKALMETARYNAEQSLGEYKEKYEALKCEQDLLSDKVRALNSSNTELQTQSSANVDELAGVRAQCTHLESETAKLRHERHLAVDERDAAAAMVARRDSELSRTQADVNLLQEQLNTATAARCEAQAQLGDLESRQLNLDYREKRLEQERQIFTTQVRSLEEQLTARTDEILNMRRDTSSRCVLLETRLSATQEELRLLQAEHRVLQEEQEDQMERYAQLQKEQCDEKRAAAQAMDAYQAEVEAQRKLAELYRLDAEAKSKHIQDLETALEEARVRLDEAVERYGDLETSSKEQRLSSEEILAKKSECINLLRKELDTANDLLSSRGRAASKVEELFPQAAQTSRILNESTNTMSLTQIYNQYVRASEQLLEEREEADRLRGYIEKIAQEMQEKGPLLAKQRDDLERAISSVDQLTHTQDEMLHEMNQLRTEAAEHKRRADREVTESERLRVQLGDLGRQVCRLLQQRDLITNDDDQATAITNTQDIISKRLVTFSSIAELQANNQRLLAVVRELSAKQEQQESSADEQQMAQLQEQLERLREAHSDLLEQQARQHKMTRTLTGQRDTYKTLYQQQVAGDKTNNAVVNNDDSSSIDGDDSHSTSNNDQPLKDKLQLLETDLNKAHKLSTQLTVENETYRKEKTANEKILIEVNERLRQETQQLTQNNTKLTATVDMNQMHLQTAKRNQELLRKQLDQLEERNKIYAQSLVKLETSVTHYKDQVYEAMTKLSKAEVVLANVQKDNALLKDAESRLSRERETFRSECQSIKVLHTNMALIKATLERSDAESKIRLEEALAEAQRECAALRRRLQEEQDRFRSLSSDLEVKTQSARQRMQEECQAADRLRQDLAQAREELQAKTAHIHDLTRSMQQSIDGATSVDGRKYREMELLLRQRHNELEALKQKLDVAREALDQHSNVAEEASKQLSVVSEQHELYRAGAEKQLEEQRTKIAASTEKCADLETELSLHRSEEMDEQTAVEGRIARLQQRLNTTLEQVKELEGGNAALQHELVEGRKLGEDASEKYSREVALHSDDLISLRTLKQAMDLMENEVRQLRMDKNILLDEQVEKEGGWKVRDELLCKEKLELERRFTEMITQNSLLHDQMQQMNSNLSVMQAQSDQLNSTNISLNRSVNEEDVKSSDQLVKIIKYLRQEKDVALSKAEIIESEQNRIKMELELVLKQLAEAKANIESERQKTEASLVANTRYAEVLRKVETMNAITDSNRTLRTERDGLLQQVAELRGENGRLEEQVAPLQERQVEMVRRTEALQSENATLRGEATRWRQRANTLIEKTNRTSPEDWKKLQTERETLAKQLTIERANIVRFTDDLATVNRDKAKLDDVVKILRATCTQQKEELARIAEELGATRAEMHAVQAELAQVKLDHNKLNAGHNTLAKELASKDGQMTDLRGQLAQVRKIAKKYKLQYEEMQKSADDRQRQDEAKTAAAAGATETLRNELNERITRLEEEIRTQQETYAATIAVLNTEKDARVIEMETSNIAMQTSKDRFAVLIKNAKDRIVELTEQRDKAIKEMADATKSANAKTTDANAAGPSGDSLLTAAAATADAGELGARLERVEQQKDLVLSEQAQERERHCHEVEELKERLAQLQRLLEDSGSGGGVATADQQQSAAVVVVTTAPPTANIKPMAGHMTQPMHAHPQHMPMASIRPLHPRSAAVPPTSQPGPSTLAVPPQQVQVHTTAAIVIDNNNSSPTSSDIQAQLPVQQQAVALVLPRTVDSAGSSPSVGIVSATSQPVSAASSSGSGSGSSSAVTTSGVKRMRDDSDSTTTTTTTTTSSSIVPTTAAAGTSSQQVNKVQAQVQPLIKRSRLIRPQPKQLQQQPLVVDKNDGGGGATMEADDAAATVGEVEYQVPTSSQRDHDDDDDDDDDGDNDEEDEAEDDADMMEDEAEEEDMPVIDLVASDDDDDDDEGGDSAEAAAAEDEDDDDREEDHHHHQQQQHQQQQQQQQQGQETDDDGDKRHLAHDDEEDDEVMDEEQMGDGEDEEDGGSAVVEGGVGSDDEGSGAVAAVVAAAQQEAQHDGGGDDGGVEATSSSATATSSSGGSGRQQQMASRHQQQQLLLPDECTDDGIVPSTPTLFVPRRGGSGGGDGVSSPHPHVPTVTQGRLFTFSEQAGASTGGEQEVLQQAADDDDGNNDVDTADQTGRSVPSTPHQLLQSPPSSEDSTKMMGPPTQAQQVEGSEEAIIGAPPSSAQLDEGREAEATPTPPGQQQQQQSKTSSTIAATSVGSTPTPAAVLAQRRSTRPVSSSSSSSGGQQGRQPTPIVWEDRHHHHQQQQQQQQQLMAPSRSSPRHPSEMMGLSGMGGRGGRGTGLPVQRARRSRGSLLPRGNYNRY